MFPKLLPQSNADLPPSNLGDFGWWIIIGANALLDLLQFVLDLFVIGLVANEIIDVVVVLADPIVLLLCGYKFDTNDMVVFGGSVVAEVMPIIDVAPFWTYDIWRFYKKDKLRKLRAQAAEEKAQAANTRIRPIRNRRANANDDDFQAAA